MEKKPDAVKLGDLLRIAREEKNLTQAEAAEKAGIHVNYYARLERGEVTPRIDIVNSVAKALGISLKLPLK